MSCSAYIFLQNAGYQSEMVVFEPSVVVCTSLELDRFPISIDFAQIQFTLWLPWSHKNNQNLDIRALFWKQESFYFKTNNNIDNWQIISLQVLQQSMVND